MNKIKDIGLTICGIFLYYFKYRKTCYKSQAWRDRYQFQKLRKLLLVCEKDIPYYRDLFNRIGFDVRRDFKTLEDIKKIPITTKETVRTRRQEFINPKNKHPLELCTSGSSGEPMSVYVSSRHWIVEQAVIWRHWAWAGYKFRDKMAIVRSYAPTDGILTRKDRVRNFKYYSPFHLSDKQIGIYLEDMIAEGVKFIRGYPSSVLALAQYVRKTKCAIPKLKGILTASEILSDYDRATIEAAFRCKISNHYGLAECIVMMGDCECHDGLHNYDEYGYLELLDTDTPHVKRVVGTNLNNYAMPLLRYDTNDLAEVDGHGCECGKTSIVVTNIIGRSNSVMKLKGCIIPLTNFFTVMEHYHQYIGSWQIIQKTEKRVILVVDRYLPEKVQEKIRREFFFRLPEDTDFGISTNGDFMKVAEGKKVPFISLVK